MTTTLQWQQITEAPYEVRKIACRVVGNARPALTWGRTYSPRLRELALANWVGCESDIAVVSRSASILCGCADTRVYLQLNANIDRVLRREFGFRWDDMSATHISEQGCSLKPLVVRLLGYYNAVCLEDIVGGRSRLYCGKPVSKRIPDVFCIDEGHGMAEVFHREDYARGRCVEVEDTEMNSLLA
jgi:hypothetical protein